MTGTETQPDPFADGRKFAADAVAGPTEELVARTSRTGRRVALTFDDGPDPRYTPRILDILAAHGITATFCLIGTKVRRYPRLAARIAEAGHLLCNHTMTHTDLIGAPRDRILAEIVDTSSAITDAVQDAPLRYFRSPYGSWSTVIRVTAMENGLQPLDWSVNPCDWANPGSARIVRVIERDLRPGGVILLHDSFHEVIDGDSGRGQTVAALGELIPRLHAGGYAFDVPALPAG